MEELFSNYLISTWSFSKVNSFARHEKAFEMQYIYNMYGRMSATTIAGSAYHAAMEFFFKSIQDGDFKDIVDLEQHAFGYIREVPANKWKIQKTTPTINDCEAKAIKVVTTAINNFFGEQNVYMDEIAEVLAVEVFITEFVTINGVDIPLPCNMKIDLVVNSTEGKRVLIDHKTKASFSDEKEQKYSIGKQAITYVKGYEARTGETVDEVWFIENKTSKNRDGSAQLKPFKIEMNADTRKLYEALLYEPLKRMLDAVSDPDYVYLINEMDNLTDKAEIYEFWAKTMIAEVDDFNIPDSKKKLIERRLKKIRDASIATIDPKIIRNFKEHASQFIQYDLSNKNMSTTEKIEHILLRFGVKVQVKHVFEGYSSNTYLLDVSAGTPHSRVKSFKLDIASALNVPNIRIMNDLYIHEGRSYLAVESSKTRDKDLNFDPSYLSGMKIPIGVDNFGKTVVWDLENPSTPHVLICGATGSGKSVSIKSTIEYSKLAGVDKIVIFDPKFEFLSYNSDPKISVYSDIEDIEEQMKLLVEDMNGLVKSGDGRRTLVIFDEFADAVANSRKGKELDVIGEVQVGTYAPKKIAGLFGETMSEPAPKMAMKKVGEIKSLEENLRILLQKGRSTGFRIMSATQRASVKVITGDAKVNFPIQICFRVPKEVDSKVVIDEGGAELLAGKGDGLMKSPEYAEVVRFQAFYKD